MLITELVFPCASDSKTFDFGLNLAGELFDSKVVKFNWAKDYLCQRVARFIIKMLDSSNDLELDKKIETCYNKFASRLIGKFTTFFDWYIIIM